VKVTFRSASAVYTPPSLLFVDHGMHDSAYVCSEPFSLLNRVSFFDPLTASPGKKYAPPVLVF
jgi:hypothetical protein